MVREILRSNRYETLYTQTLRTAHDDIIDVDFDNNAHYTLEEAINNIGLGKFQWFILSLTVSLWLCASIQLMCTPILLIFIQRSSSLSSITNIQKNILTALPFLGDLFGAFLLPMFSDKYGRRKSIIISALLLSFFSTLSAISYNFYMLLLCRFFIGCAVGGSSTTLSLITEFIPKSHRGQITFIQISFWSFGSLIAIAIGCLMFYADMSWRWFLLFCSSPSWICVFLTFFIPESLRWLINNGDFIKVQRQLHKMAVCNECNAEKLRGSLIQSNAVDHEQKGNIKSIFIKQHIRTSMQIMITMLAVTCSYFGVALYQSVYLQQTNASMNAMLFQMFLCSLSEIPSMIIGTIIIDKFGRITIMYFSFPFAAMCFFGIAINISNAVCIILIFLARMFVFTAFNVLFIYVLEYYPTTIRATALGFNITLGRITAICTSFIAQDLSVFVSSLIFAVCCVISTISTYLLPVETLGRTLADDDDDNYDFVHAALYEFDIHHGLRDKLISG